MQFRSANDPRAKKERLAAALYEREKRIERARQSDLGEIGRQGGLIHFVRCFWHILEPTTEFIEGWVVNAICIHLEAVTRGEINRLMINVFPGAMKSLLVNVMWPAWEWSAAGMPSTRYVTFSYGAHLTIRDNSKFRDVITHPDFKEIWGHVFELKKAGEIKPENDKTGWKFASSVGGIGTGERGNRLLADDLHNVKSAESETIRAETVRWVREGMANRLNDMANDAIIGIGQRVHEEDASAAMLEDGDYVSLRIPMKYDSSWPCSTRIGWSDPRTSDGELAWPERFPKSVVDKLESTLGPYAFSAQYQQAPSPRGGGIIKREWWEMWEEPAFPVCEYKWASLDSAYTTDESNDPSGLVIFGTFNHRGKQSVVLMDAWRKRLEIHTPARWKDERPKSERLKRVQAWQRASQNFYEANVNEGCPEPVCSPDVEPWRTYIETGENNADRWPSEATPIYNSRTQEKWGLCEWLAHSCRRFKINTLIIESKASGLSVAQEIKRLHANEGWGVQTVTPEGDKGARLMSVQGMFSSGLVYAPDREWAQMVIDEVSSFPRGKFRDLTDATSQALKHVRDLGLLMRPEERRFEELENAKYRQPSKILYPV